MYDNCSVCFKDHYLLYATLEVLSTIRGLRRSSEQIVIFMFIQPDQANILLLFPASLLLTIRSGARYEIETLIGGELPPHNTTKTQRVQTTLDWEIKYLQSCRSTCQTLLQVGNNCWEHVLPQMTKSSLSCGLTRSDGTMKKTWTHIL